ncbi:hypothetical protein F5Y04DRAFT_274053 [Hypomontagnella monticulosa]|nr:hypothetical protein F5Y04DRAFT_274053 [Hypomontagnella monticulosa]
MKARLCVIAPSPSLHLLTLVLEPLCSVGLEPARTLTPDSELTKIPTSAFRDTGRTDQDLSQTETVCSPDHEVQRARDESDDVLQQSIRKSQHRPQPLTRRRRNLTSCLLCRSRKTKCDNKRPSCGYCILHGANCTYPDAPIDPTRLGLGIGLRALQASQDDVSNSVLLQRINHAVSLLESFRDSNSTQEPSTSPAFQPSRHLGLERQNDRVDFSAESAFTDDGFGRLEVPEAAARTSACESILQWPVLGLSEEEQVTSFPLQAAASESIPEQRRQLPLDQDSIWPLCQRFLILIHIKNPVLDVSEFKRYARGAAEYGPGWDGPGCLVLLACALACLTNPYNPTQVQNTIESGSDLHDSEISADGGAEANAEAFFNAAQRRLGLLPNSLIAIQCAYFAGLYEKFAIRPLDAWNRLQGACVRFQALLYAKALSSNTAGHEEQRARHIEQRLYWSCVKAECELRAEMQLPASGLLRFKYPDLFPALPASEAGNYSALEEERSWLYYLAEISLRNIMNRVLADFYGYGEVAWLNDTASLVKRHAAYSEELESWRTHLPLQLQFLSPMEEPLGIPEPPGNELSFFLQTRYLCVIEWLHRPFLYCIIYSNSLAQTSDYEPLIRLAQRGIEASCALIRIIAAHHRHGGIWSLARRSFGCSLLLIASARYNLQNDNPGNQASFSMRRYVRLPPGWRILVQITLATIRIWEGSGARDLQWMRKTLERLMELVKM